MKNKSLSMLAVTVLGIGGLVLGAIKVNNELSMTKEYRRQAEAQENLVRIGEAADALKEQTFEIKTECTISRRYDFPNSTVCFNNFECYHHETEARRKLRTSITCSQ